MRHFLVTLTSIILAINLYAGDSLRVLFIGNSYIYTYNIPDIIKNIANADGNSLNYSVSVPGGQTLQQHCSNTTTLNFIQQGNWDYVVLQEQSQVPSFPDSQVATQFYPYAKKLDSLIHVFSPCAKTVFYITWGRKNGDAQNCQYFPPLCTYEGMDDLLTLRYSNVADTTNAYLSPVGPLWRSLRANHPTIELYSNDESHHLLLEHTPLLVVFMRLCLKRIFRTLITISPFLQLMHRSYANKHSKSLQII